MAETFSEGDITRSGRFAAMELAMNARYGVAVANSPLSQQLVDATLYGSESDVVGAVFRDLNVGTLFRASREEHELPRL
jgi:hypothetical protein